MSSAPRPPGRLLFLLDPHPLVPGAGCLHEPQPGARAAAAASALEDEVSLVNHAVVAAPAQEDEVTPTVSAPPRAVPDVVDPGARRVALGGLASPVPLEDVLAQPPDPCRALAPAVSPSTLALRGGSCMPWPAVSIATLMRRASPGY